MLSICGQKKYQVQQIALTEYFSYCTCQWICLNSRRALQMKSLAEVQTSCAILGFLFHVPQSRSQSQIYYAYQEICSIEAAETLSSS